MPIRQTVGILYVVTAIVSGYWGLRVMFTPSFGGRFFWWPLIFFGAPILLLVGGILTLFPQLKKRWLLALTGTIFFLIWVAFIRDSMWIFWIFAVAVTLVIWGVLTLSSLLQKGWVVARIASLLLAALWIPPSVHALSVYFSQWPSNPDPLELLWAPDPSPSHHCVRSFRSGS